MIAATGRRLAFVRVRMGLRRSEVGQILGVAAGTIYRWERFEAETIRTRRGNARLVAAFASLTKLARPKDCAMVLRGDLGLDDTGVTALTRTLQLCISEGILPG